MSGRGPCSAHRRRDAVASCASCGSPMCGVCVVSTRVGLKCQRCTGGRAAAGAGPRRRAVLVAGVLTLFAAAAAGFALAGRGEETSRAEESTSGPIERVVQISGAGRVGIAGTFRLPERTREKPVPAVLIIPGFGPTDRNGVPSAGGEGDPLYRDVSHELAERGMASLRYDKRGTGQSVLPAGSTLTFDDMAADARAGIDFLAQRADVDRTELAVVGHDEGALVAMRVAAGDPRVTAVVLISSPGRPLVDVIADDFRATGGDASADRLRGVVAGLLATGTLPPREALAPEHRDFFPTDHVPYLREIFSIDPVAFARDVKVPALVVRGGRATFSTAADADRIARAIGPTAEIVVAPAAGPSLALVREPGTAGGRTSQPGVTAGGGARPARERDVGALEQISGWLGEQLVANRG